MDPLAWHKVVLNRADDSLGMLLHPHRGISDLPECKESPSISRLLPLVIDRYSLIVCIAPTRQSTALDLLSKEGEEANDINPNTVPVETRRS